MVRIWLIKKRNYSGDCGYCIRVTSYATTTLRYLWTPTSIYFCSLQGSESRKKFEPQLRIPKAPIADLRLDAWYSELQSSAVTPPGSPKPLDGGSLVLGISRCVLLQTMVEVFNDMRPATCQNHMHGSQHPPEPATAATAVLEVSGLRTKSTVSTARKPTPKSTSQKAPRTLCAAGILEALVESASCRMQRQRLV